MADVLVIKIGGAVLTDKAKYRTLRPLDDVLHAITSAWHARGSSHLIIVHGAGSFGHHDVRTAALKGATLDGASGSCRVALGVATTRASLALLHAELLSRLTSAGVPAITIPMFPYGLQCSAGISAALRWGLVPVLHGDIAVDERSGEIHVLSGDLLIEITDNVKQREMIKFNKAYCHFKMD